MAKYVIGDIFEGDYPITQYYNENPQIYTMFQVPGHEGVDWGTPNGTPIIAPFDGIILRDTFADKDYGNFTVVWDPKQKCALWYCHLQDLATQVGDRVTKGQLLGHTNNTGNSTGPHLHIDFVETDEVGNRLNMDNGKQGFLNIMDSDLVEWKLGDQPDPQPVEQPTESPEQPAPVVEVIPMETQTDPGQTTTVSTTQATVTLNTSPVTETSNQTVTVPIPNSGDNQPPVQTNPVVPHDPTPAPWRLSDLIVFVLLNIKNVLKKLWSNISLKSQ